MTEQSAGETVDERPKWLREADRAKAWGEAARSRAANERARWILHGYNHYGRGSRDQIATELGISVGEVDKALARARNLPRVERIASVDDIIGALAEYARRARYGFLEAQHAWERDKDKLGEGETAERMRWLGHLGAVDENAFRALLIALQAADTTRQNIDRYEDRAEALVGVPAQAAMDDLLAAWKREA